MKNVAVYFINSKGYVMMLQCRETRKWMTPGGMIDNYETPFKGMIREFKEETNSYFPLHNYTILNEWVWNNHTKLYLIHSNHRFPNVFKATNETVRRRFVHYTQLLYFGDLKLYVRKSMKELRVLHFIDSIF
jgi:8-oxo-dGTP pyrophosphatase MutT (NUDIX family)